MFVFSDIVCALLFFHSYISHNEEYSKQLVYRIFSSSFMPVNFFMAQNMEDSTAVKSMLLLCHFTRDLFFLQCMHHFRLFFSSLQFSRRGVVFVSEDDGADEVRHGVEDGEDLGKNEKYGDK